MRGVMVSADTPTIATELKAITNANSAASRLLKDFIIIFPPYKIKLDFVLGFS
jgi:hypothetical protein